MNFKSPKSIKSFVTINHKELECEVFFDLDENKVDITKVIADGKDVVNKIGKEDKTRLTMEILDSVSKDREMQKSEHEAAEEDYNKTMRECADFYFDKLL